MRTLAIDLGSRRMGLALSDEGGRLATPLRVVEVASPAQAARLAAQAAQKHHAEQLLVGLPLNIDGSAGPAAAGALAWGKSLARLCHLPLIFVDERLSSFTADQWLVDQKRSRPASFHAQRKKEAPGRAGRGGFSTGHFWMDD
jgi:putative holliday junction resolvase